MQRYIVDGYNLLFQLEEEHQDLEKQRKKLLSSLEELTTFQSLDITFVFDSSTNNAWTFEYWSSIKVVFAPLGTSADQYIVEMLHGSKYPATYTVVTSDKHLKSLCREIGAQVQTIPSFFSWVSKKEKKERPKEMKDTPFHIQRLKQIFEEKLSD